MKEYYGLIEFVSVINTGESRQDVDSNGPVFIPLKANDICFIHYPDCQQLNIRLPQSGYNYEVIRIWYLPGETIAGLGRMANYLNGEVKLSWDTLSLRPGSYRADIVFRKGYNHSITFIKHPAVAGAEAKETILYAGYSDNNKPVLPAAQIEYDGNARAGTITYVEGSTRVKFSHEMGGGNCVFFVFIPTEEEWERATGTGLLRRSGILQFIAETLQREQAPGRRFEIEYNQITFYYH